MKGISDLSQLIENISPELQEGDFVFVSVSDLNVIPQSTIQGLIREKEGTSVILNRQTADNLKLQYNFIASWITLNVHSSLDAVGLTAMFSAALAQEGISCNVMAGCYHDHIFVHQKDKEVAVKILNSLRNKQ